MRTFVQILSISWLSAIPAIAEAKTIQTSKLPNRVFSVSESETFEKDAGGPLFLKMRTIIRSTSTGGDVALRRFVEKDAKLALYARSANAIDESPFNADLIKAATSSCLGPFPYRESSDWVQFSWVCRTDPTTKLAERMQFRNSPELSVTVWFDKGLIETAVANEPLVVPGQKYLGMNAASWLEGKR